MRSIAKTVGFCFSVGLMTCLAAQTPTESAPGNLELRLEAQSAQRNTPEAFTILIVNKADHEVRLPIPSVGSGDVPHGTVWLRVNFVPQKRGTLPEPQVGASRTSSTSQLWNESRAGRCCDPERA